MLRSFIFFLLMSSFAALSASGVDFIVASPQKCGTHLLIKAAELLTKKEHSFYLKNHPAGQKEWIALLNRAKKQGLFLASHPLPEEFVLHTLKKKKHKILFIIRDPRDQLISAIKWFEQGCDVGPESIIPLHTLPSQEERLIELITGEKFHYQVCNEIRKRLKWLKQDPTFLLSTSFEKLIGKNGGGSNEKQLAELKKIAQFLHASSRLKNLVKVQKELFGGTSTFHKGQIGLWKTVFTERVKLAFKEHFGDLLIELGYEQDHNW